MNSICFRMTSLCKGHELILRPEIYVEMKMMS